LSNPLKELLDHVDKIFEEARAIEAKRIIKPTTEKERDNV
jgi:hypothetical protein